MTSLITILIALLGYGTPSDFSHMSENQLTVEIAQAEAADADGGTGNPWDSPSAQDDPDENGGDNQNP